MSGLAGSKLSTILAGTFALFAFASTFSIALSQMALGVSLVLFLILMIKTGEWPYSQKLKNLYLLITAYIFCSLMAALSGATPKESVLILKEEWLFLIVPMGILVLRQASGRRQIVIALTVGVALLGLYGVIQHFTGANWFRSNELHAAGAHTFKAAGNFNNRLTFGNYFGVAGFFLICLCLAGGSGLSRLWNRIMLTAGILALAATAFSYCRSVVAATIACAVLAGILLGKRHGWKLAAAAGVAVVAIWLLVPGLAGRFTGDTAQDLNPKHESGRLYIWSRSWDIIRENPVIGIGTGNFYDEYSSRVPDDVIETRRYTHAHNDLINIAVINGIPGALIFLALWLYVLWLQFRLWRADPGSVESSFAFAGLMASVLFLLTSMTEATFADEEVRQLLMLIWAAGLWPLYKQPSAAIGGR